MTPLVLAAAAALTAPGPALHDLRVTNGSTPYLGDRRLLTTVSPNRDGFRDAAVVHFRLLRRATVRRTPREPRCNSRRPAALRFAGPGRSLTSLRPAFCADCVRAGPSS